MPEIKFYKKDNIPMEMHKVKIVQQLTLLPTKDRLVKIRESGYNTFKLHNGDIDLVRLENFIKEKGKENISFLRIEAGTNLIGGQPISYENMREATNIAKKYNIVTVLDASLLQDNLYFIKTREENMKDKSIKEILRMISDLFDIIYFSGRKFGFARGGGILVRDEEMFHSMEDLIPMFEGFLTYGGTSVKEMEVKDLCLWNYCALHSLEEYLLYLKQNM